MLVLYFVSVVGFGSFFFITFLQKVWGVSTPHKRDESTKKMIELYQREAHAVSHSYKTINGETMRIIITTSSHVRFKRTDTIYVQYEDVHNMGSEMNRKGYLLKCLETKLKSWDTSFSKNPSIRVTTSY